MAAVEKVCVALSPEEAEIERLRKAWREGIESGPSRLLDFEEIKRKAEQRLKALQASRNG
jgi:antitoxin ParD1/3/4